VQRTGRLCDVRCESCGYCAFTNCLDGFAYTHIGRLENRRIQFGRCFVRLLGSSPASPGVSTSSRSRKRQFFWYIRLQRSHSAAHNGPTRCRLALRWRTRRPRLLRLARRREHFSKATCTATSHGLLSERSGGLICCRDVLCTPTLDHSGKSHAGPICTGSQLCTGSIELRSVRVCLCVSLHSGLPAVWERSSSTCCGPIHSTHRPWYVPSILLATLICGSHSYSSHVLDDDPSSASHVCTSSRLPPCCYHALYAVLLLQPYVYFRYCYCAQSVCTSSEYGSSTTCAENRRCISVSR
jgi:hypothetical protein